MHGQCKLMEMKLLTNYPGKAPSHSLTGPEPALSRHIYKRPPGQK
jgi:hypothetical protein